MRTITIPPHVIERAAHGPVDGRCVGFAVEVDWPELRLTESQMIENAIARAFGRECPHPDQRIFLVEVSYIPSAMRGTP